MNNFVPNSFQVPNAFVDEVLNKISDAACKIYLVICRKTRGWNKEMDSISLSQFEEITGKSRPTVVKCLNELIKVGLVVEQPSTIHGNTFKLGNDTSVGLVLKFPSKNFLLPEIYGQTSKNSLPLLVKNFNYTSKNFLPLLVKIFNTQSITIKNNSQSNKKINKKRESVSEKPKTEKPNEFNPRSVELPACVDPELWNNFVDMRVSIQPASPTINFKIEVINQVSGATVEAEQLDEQTVRIIVKDEMDKQLPRTVPKLVSDQIANPNSTISRSLTENTTARRNR
ncbi:TPA: MarR family transcriptional regulator [Acinetobacter baumannii]|nr:MarR family transcriptional regulator [Acinetobacter baumannii]